MRARIVGGMLIGLLVGCASTPRNEQVAASRSVTINDRSAAS